MFWDVARSFVQGFVAARRATFEAELGENIRAFSRALEGNSPRFRLLDGRGPQAWREGDRSELTFKPEGMPSMSPIESIDDVIEFATFAIFHATFFHSWVNDSQWEDCADPTWASFGLRSRRAPQGADPATWRRDALPLIKHAGFQMALMRILASTNVGYIARDTETPPGHHAFGALLNEQANRFDRLNDSWLYRETLDRFPAQSPAFGRRIDVRRIRSHINT
jgi:hypothetical protein